MLISWIRHQQEGMREASTNYWGLGPVCVAYVFVFLSSIIICGLTTLSDQAQITLQLTVFPI
jgi:hypothetical protein